MTPLSSPTCTVDVSRTFPGEAASAASRHPRLAARLQVAEHAFPYVGMPHVQADVFQLPGLVPAHSKAPYPSL